MIAGFLGGQVARRQRGQGAHRLLIEEGEPGALTYLTNPKYEKNTFTKPVRRSYW